MPEGDLYFAKSAQMAVMSEFLARGYNAATPEVDIGTDVFVVRDSKSELWKVQVKARRTDNRNYGHSKQFPVPLVQLETPDERLYYVFAARNGGRWRDFLIIQRQELDELRVAHSLGSLSKGTVLFNLCFRDAPADVSCGDISFQQFRNTWERKFPSLI